MGKQSRDKPGKQAPKSELGPAYKMSAPHDDIFEVGGRLYALRLIGENGRLGPYWNSYEASEPGVLERWCAASQVEDMFWENAAVQNTLRKIAERGYQVAEIESLEQVLLNGMEDWLVDLAERLSGQVGLVASYLTARYAHEQWLNQLNRAQAQTTPEEHNDQPPSGAKPAADK